jgi:hypothetical protein
MKTRTICVGNSNNYPIDSILSGKSETVVSGCEFMGIRGYKVLFNWLRYPNMCLYIDLRELSIHFLVGRVISATKDDSDKTTV